ncbi:MAG: hypothetical protein AABY07_00010 [Nanoarchaeota archaeon]
MNKDDVMRSFMWIGVGIIAIFLIYNSYDNRNWDEEYVCISWDLYDNSTCDKPTNNCHDIERVNNAWLQECSCNDLEVNDLNKTQKIICNGKQVVERYTKK